MNKAILRAGLLQAASGLRLVCYPSGMNAPRRRRLRTKDSVSNQNNQLLKLGGEKRHAYSRCIISFN